MIFAWNVISLLKLFIQFSDDCVFMLSVRCMRATFQMKRVFLFFALSKLHSLFTRYNKTKSKFRYKFNKVLRWMYRFILNRKCLINFESTWLQNFCRNKKNKLRFHDDLLENWIETVQTLVATFHAARRASISLLMAYQWFGFQALIA